MVTVSSIINNYSNKPVSSGVSVFSNTKGQSSSNVSFQAEAQPLANTKPKEDVLLKNDVFSKIRLNLDKAVDIPLAHIPRGMGGAPDYTFFEFLQTAKVPYYLGGPILAALFNAGVKMDSIKSGNAAKMVAKHMALGVGFYYLGAIAAKSIIDNTVRIARGVDLNQPYAKVIPTSTKDTGMFKKDFELHKATESIDFTRWDLFYNKEGKTPEEINEKYAKFAKKYGIKDDANDIDASVKPLIKKTIVMARAWQYALTAFFVTLGIGLANQPVWEKVSHEGFRNTVKNGIFGKNLDMKSRLNSAKIAVYDYMIKPFGKSFSELWKGHSKASSIAGKSIILSTAAATLLAISLIVGKTSARSHKIDNSGTNKIGGGKQ